MIIYDLSRVIILLQELALARAASYVTSFPQPLKDDGPGLTLGFNEESTWNELQMASSSHIK